MNYLSTTIKFLYKLYNHLFIQQLFLVLSDLID